MAAKQIALSPPNCVNSNFKSNRGFPVSTARNFNPSSFSFTITEESRHRSNHFVTKLGRRGQQRAEARAESAVERRDEESGDVVEEGHHRPSSASWVDGYLPEIARPYAYLLRLNDQIGPWQFGWPYFLSIAMAAEQGKLLDVKMLALFLVIAFMERNIALTVNDILDQDIDAKIERTRMRPIAAGSITTPQAICFLGFQVLINFCLYRQVNSFSRTLWILSLLFSFTYPLTKRITHWSQAYFGMTMNWGGLLGWAAIKGSLEELNVVLPLYISGFFWTLMYETIYACQDKEEDHKLGLKSTAVLFGDSIKNWLTAFGVAAISGFALTGSNANIGWPYYASLIPASWHFVWQIVTVDLTNAADCETKQMSNKWVGAFLMLGIVFGKLVS